MKEDEYITQHHPDGSTTTIPKHLFKDVVDTRPVDWMARAVAVGGMLIGAGALVYEATRAVVQPKDNSAEIKALQTQVYKDELMACLDENILKSAVGFPGGSFQDCQDEKDYAATMAADKPNTLFPETTPTPKPAGGA